LAIEDLNDLYLFGRVVDAGGFAAAERQTGIPKSRFSRRVAALEKELGVRLIQRTAHQFQVTEIGQGVYQHARSIADQADAVVSAVGAALAEPSGLIRVSSSVLIGEAYLAAWIADFMALHPKVRVNLDLSNRFVDLLTERIDLAIRFVSKPLPSSDIVAKPLGAARMVLVASPELLATYGEPADIADLERFPTVAQGSFDSVRSWLFKDARGATVQYHPQPRFVSDNVMALRDAAARGIGLAQLPLDACSHALHGGTLHSVLESSESVGTPLYAMYPSRHGMPSGVRALLTFIEQRFRDRPMWSGAAGAGSPAAPDGRS